MHESYEYHNGSDIEAEQYQRYMEERERQRPVGCAVMIGVAIFLLLAALLAVPVG